MAPEPVVETVSVEDKDEVAETWPVAGLRAQVGASLAVPVPL
jgi:hypothetical protein